MFGRQRRQFSVTQVIAKFFFLGGDTFLTYTVDVAYERRVELT